MRSGEGGSRTSDLCTPWAEASTGTTGVGTALVARGPVAVRRFEHWCAAFHDWSCAAVAVRRPDGSPIGVVGSPCGDGPFPSTRASGSRMRRRVSSGGSRARGGARAPHDGAGRAHRARRPRPHRGPARWADDPPAGRRSARRRARARPRVARHVGGSRPRRGARPRRARGTARACGLPPGEPNGDREPAPGARDRAVVQGRRVGGDRRRGVGRGVEAAACRRFEPPSASDTPPFGAEVRPLVDAGSTARRPHRFRDASAAR